MTRVKIYDSEGYEYGREGAKRNEQIASFFTSSVRAIIDASSTSIKMICYFRAREGKGQRTEQFYAEYGAESLKSVYREFKSSVEKKAKELGLEMDYSRESTHILRDIDRVDPGYPGLSDTDKRGVKSLIEKREREKLEFGASDYNVATRAAKAAAYRDRVVAISDSGRVSEIKNVDVVFDTRYNGRGLEPSKKTKRKVKDVRRKARQKQVKESLNNVREELQKLKSLSGKEGVSRSDVNDRLKNIVRNEFPNIFPKRKTTVSQTEQTATRSTQSRSVFDRYLLPVMAIGAVIILLLLALGPLSGVVDIPVLGGILSDSLDSDIIKNIIEALFIVAVVILVSAVVDAFVDDAPGAPAVLVSGVAFVLIVGTVAAAGMGFIGSLGGSADPGGADTPAGNESNSEDPGATGGTDTDGTDDGGDDTGNGGGGTNGPGGGDDDGSTSGNGGGSGSMMNEYESFREGGYSLTMTITEEVEDEGKKMNVYSDGEGCIKYNATEESDVETRLFKNAEDSLYGDNTEYKEGDEEWTGETSPRTVRDQIGILYGEFIPTGKSELEGNGERTWTISETTSFDSRLVIYEHLPKKVVAERDGGTLTVEYSDPNDRGGISSSLCSSG